MRKSAPRFQLVGAALALGAAACLTAGCDNGATASPDLGSPDLATASPDDAGTSPDLATPPPKLPRYAVGGTVYAVLHAGNSWYLGGTFNRISPYNAPNLIPVDATGTPTACPIGTGFDGAVTAAVYAGNSIYVGGIFTHYQGASANRLAKIDATTCALDTTFSPPASNGTDGLVLTLAASATALYVGGQFSNYRGASASHIAKVDLATGALDTTFSPAASNGFDGNVSTLVVAGTAVYVGGSFTKYRGVASSANRLAKLDQTSGAIDTTFSPAGATSNGFDDIVNSLAASPTALYAGGFFTAYRGVAGSATRLAKLDLTTGALDTTFSPPGANNNGVNDIIMALATSGNSVYAGGRFTAYRNVAGAANLIAKLDASSGALDTTFSPAASNGFLNTTGASSQVSALTVSGNSLYVGGIITGYRGTDKTAYGMAKLDATTGAQDVTFLPSGSNANGVSGGITPNAPTVNAIVVQGTTVWLLGRFSVYGGYAVNHLAKLDDTSFAVDTTFSPPTNNGFENTSDSVTALAASGTALYIGGSFNDYRKVTNSAHRLAKLDLATGAIDTTFSPVGATANGFDNQVRALVVAGNSLYVGGLFTAYRGVAASAKSLAKLDLSTGAIDTTFSPVGATANGFDNYVHALAVAGTSLYVGGSFSMYRGVAGSANKLVKLDLTSGALDANFIPMATGGLDGAVQALAISGTSIYAGGFFTAYAGVTDSAHRLAKLDLSTGAIDTTFSPVGATANGFDNTVYALAVSGNALYVGGDFSAYRGVASSANHLAKLDLASGAIDTTFSPVGATANGADNSVYAVGASGASLIVGGQFTSYRGSASSNRALAVVNPASGAIR